LPFLAVNYLIIFIQIPSIPKNQRIEAIFFGYLKHYPIKSIGSPLTFQFEKRNPFKTFLFFTFYFKNKRIFIAVE